MNLNKHKIEEEQMDMTPMIDVVFLLIIFFMLISDMTQQDLEILTLPKAVSAVPDEPDVKDFRPVVNVRQNGVMVVKQDEVFVPTAEGGTDDEQGIKQTLLTFSDLMDTDFFNKELKTGAQIPDDFLLIRADQWTPFHYVQRIMTLCGDTDIQIWKVQLAAGTVEEEKEKP